MIRVETRLKYEDEKMDNLIYEFGITGHSGLAGKGHDIVCAAVSAIEHLFVTWILDTDAVKPLECVREDGATYIKMRVKNEISFLEIRRFIEAGFADIAAEYPENVTFMRAH